MKLNLKKDIDVLKMLDIYCFKKALKPIKTTNTEKFLDSLINRANLLLSCLNRGFDLEDHEIIDLTCSLTCNIPLEFSAYIGNGANCWITGEKLNGESLNIQGHSDKAELLEYLESITLPNEIVFKTLDLHQKIGKSESKFTISIDK